MKKFMMMLVLVAMTAVASVGCCRYGDIRHTPEEAEQAQQEQVDQQN